MKHFSVIPRIQYDEKTTHLEQLRFVSTGPLRFPRLMFFSLCAGSMRLSVFLDVSKLQIPSACVFFGPKIDLSNQSAGAFFTRLRRSVARSLTPHQSNQTVRHIYSSASLRLLIERAAVHSLRKLRI